MLSKDASGENHCGSLTQWISLKELCRRSGFSSASIHRWKDKGLIPFFQPGGKRGHLRFPPDALERMRETAAIESSNGSPTAARNISKLSGPIPKWKR